MWGKRGATATAVLVVALAVSYHLYVQAELEREAPAEVMENSEVEQVVEQARKSIWPLQAQAMLQEELLRGAGSCAPGFEANCLLRHGRYRPSSMILLLDALGDNYAQVMQHDKARATHLAALEQKRRALRPPGELATSYSALATDEMNLFHLEEALTWLRQAQQLTLPAEILSLLYEQEAMVLECQDDFVSALHIFEHSLNLLASATATHLRRRYELIGLVLRGDVPDAVARALRARRAELAQELVVKGYGQADQFPKRYVRGLRGQAWQDLDVDWMSSAAALVKSMRSQLLREYEELKEAQKMYREQECIHSHGAQWTRFEINSLWHRTDEGGIRCAVESPRACGLFQQLEDLGMPLIRAGYSAVTAGAWLKPHFGTTNAQIKWHLGLSIPSTPTEQCARLRVANVTKAWVQGEILAFDDSFEHEVINACDAERVVFQMVFAHPQLGRGESAVSCATGEAPCDVA